MNDESSIIIYINFLRDEILANEMAGLHDRRIAITTCGAYRAPANRTQDDNNDYEAIPLKDFEPLSPAQASSPAQNNEDTLSPTNEASAFTYSDTVSVPTESSSAKEASDDKYYEGTCTIPPPAATTVTGALLTTTLIQEEEYEEMDYHAEDLTATKEKGISPSSDALGES